MPLGLHNSNKPENEVTGDVIAVTPQVRKFSRTKRYTIEELFEDYEDTYEPPSDWPLTGNEIDWGKPQGREIW